ncbi:MAG: hypothetical protein HZB65_01655 [Candidatus Aenigmarchaeota archaeon]|nr:hypothetical protein [Candidatus Aenigmarchaeota archaeon]
MAIKKSNQDGSEKDQDKNKDNNISKTSPAGEFRISVSYTLLTGLVAITLIILLVGVFMMNSANSTLVEKAKFSEEEARPANLNIIKLVSSDCVDCFDVDSVITKITQSNTKITDMKTVDVYSADGQVLVNKYNIERVPTVLISGETSKSTVKSMLDGIGDRQPDGTVVFTDLQPVYINLLNNQTIGRVSITIILDPSYNNYTNLTLVVDRLREAGITIANTTILNLSETKAKEMIREYNLTKIPALIFSDDLAAYEALVQAWSQVGSVESDRSYVLREINPPYLNLSSGQIVGQVVMINLADSSCLECYDIGTAKKILETGFGIFIANETIYDIDSTKGKELLKKYNITAVPTFLLSSQANAYVSLNEAWAQVGTVEADGWYVFREIKALGDVAYRDLETNTTIKP